MISAQSLARLEEGIVIEGTFSLAGGCGGKWNEGSAAAAERLYENNQITV